MEISFAGKSVLITGAAGAIGARCAELIGQLRGRRFLTDAHLPLACDVTRSDEVERLRREVLAQTTALDAMVLCAGIYRPAPIAQMSDEDWRATLEVNLTQALKFDASM